MLPEFSVFKGKLISMKRRLKQVLFGTLVFFGVLFLLLIIIVFYVKTDHAQSLIQKKVNAMIMGSLSWDDLNFSLLQGKIELTEFVVKDHSNADLLGFKRFYIDIEWLTLFRGDLTVATLVLTSPRGDVILDKNGKINLLQALSSPEPKESIPPEPEPTTDEGELAFNVVIKDLRIEQGSFKYKQLTDLLQASLEDLQIKVQGNLLNESGQVSVVLKQAQLEGSDFHAQVTPFSLQAQLDQGNLTQLDLQIKTQSSQIGLTGQVLNVLKKPELDLELKMQVALPEIQDFIHLKQPLTGQISSVIHVQDTLENPTVTASLDYGGGQLTDYTLDKIDFDLKLQDRQIKLQNLLVLLASGELNLNGEADLREAFPQGFLSPDQNLEAITYQIELHEKDIHLHELLKEGALAGVANADITLRGSGVKKPDAQLLVSLIVQQLKMIDKAEPVDVQLTADTKIAKNQVTIEPLNVLAGDISIALSGLYNLDSEDLQAQIKLDAPDLAALSSFGVPDVKGSFEFESTLSGTLKQPLVDITCGGEKLLFQDITIGKVRFLGNLDEEGTFHIVQLALNNDGSRISGQGSAHVLFPALKFDSQLPLDISLQLTSVETSDFLEKDEYQGQVDGSMKVSGTLDALVAEVQLIGKQLAVKPAHIGDLDLALKLSDGKIDVKHLTVRNKDSRINLTAQSQLFTPGTLSVVDDIPVHLNLVAKSLQLQDFIKEYKGKLSLNADLTGSVGNPQGTLDIEGSFLDFGVQKLEKFVLNSRIDGQKISFNPLRIVLVPGEEIEGKGWFNLDKTYQVSLKSDGFSLKNIDQVKDIGQGFVRIDMAGAGSVDAPQLEGDLTIDQIRLKEQKIGDFKVALSIHDQKAHLTGNLDFDLEGIFDLTTHDFSAALVFNETDLVPYFKVAGQNDLNGTLTGKIEAKGNVGQIDQLTADASFSKLDVFYQQEQLVHSKEFLITYTQQAVNIKAFDLGIHESGFLKMKGQGNVSGPLDFDLEGKIPLRIASFFVEDIPDFKGQLLLDAQLKGSVSEPGLTSELTLDKVGFTVPGLEQLLHDLNGRIQISPQAVIIQDLQGLLDEGRLAVSGKADLEQFQPTKVDLKLTANNLPVKVPDTIDLVLNTSITLDGTPEKSAIKGDIVILEGLYYQDIDLSLTSMVSGGKTRETAPQSEPITTPFLKNMSFDITVKRRDPFIVDNNLAQLEVNPDLRISGLLNSPIISGRAEIEKGDITYQKKKFVVNKGVIDFLNPYKIEPTLDIESEIKIRDWAIFLIVFGTPDALEFKLKSKPELEHGDILSLIVIGRTTGELVEGEGGSSQSTEQMLAEMIATTFGEDIKSKTGLDIFEVETGEEGQSESDRIQVTLGKQLSRRLVVKYAVESKSGEVIQRAISEYKLLQNLILSGSQDTKGVFGGELQYRLEFR